MPVARNVAVKRLNKRRQARPRRFLVRPGRTNVWWSGFVNQIVVVYVRTGPKSHEVTSYPVITYMNNNPLPTTTEISQSEN